MTGVQTCALPIFYSPAAFQGRLIGNLQRFENVRFRPERIRWELLSGFLQLARHNWRQGPRARRFFWGSLWATLRHSPRSIIPVNMQLGMYGHFALIHSEAWSWNPWESEPEQESVAKAPEAVYG